VISEDLKQDLLERYTANMALAERGHQSFDVYPVPTVTELYLSAAPNWDMLLFMPGFLPMRRYHIKPGYTAPAGEIRTIMFRSYKSFFGSSRFEYCDTIHRGSALANTNDIRNQKSIPNETEFRILQYNTS